MAIFCIHQLSTSTTIGGETCVVRPGDIVFHWNPGAKAQLHTGIYTEEKKIPSETTALRILSLPDPDKDPWPLGESDWKVPGHYWHLDIVGQRLDVDEIQVADAANFAREHTTELSQLASGCTWDKVVVFHLTATVRGKPLFLKGSCSQHAWWIYQCVGLELVTYEPATGARLWPAILIHAFWSGTYPLDPEIQEVNGKLNPIDPRLAKYPDCLFGQRSTNI